MAQALHAQAPVRNHLYDRLQISLSGTVVFLGPNVRVDGGSGTPGTDLDGDAMGLSPSTFEPRAALRWRLGRRHELDMGYQLAQRSGGRVLTDTIQLGDTSFAAGLRIESQNQADQAWLGYRFAFHARERSQIGAALGLGAIFFGFDIQAVAGATSGGPDTTITRFGVKRSVTAPTASLGLFGRWRSGDRWYIESDARVLFFEIGRIGVNVVEAGAAVRYFVKPKIGLELGYGFTGVKVTLDPGGTGSGSELSGRLKYTLQNLRFSVVATP